MEGQLETQDAAAALDWAGGKRIAQIVTLALALAAALTILVMPSYARVSRDSAGNETMTTETVLAVNGPQVLVILVVPVVLTLVPLLLRGRLWLTGSIVCTVLLAAGVVVGSLSLGVFFAPALLAAIIALFLPPLRAGR